MLPRYEHNYCQVCCAACPARWPLSVPSSLYSRVTAGRLNPREFNSYGSRRGNDAVMARGTFANIRLVNRLVERPGPRTVHLPSGEEMDVFDAADRYRGEGRPLIVLAGRDYGSGSSRDWAAKGPFLMVSTRDRELPSVTGRRSPGPLPARPL